MLNTTFVKVDRVAGAGKPELAGELEGTQKNDERRETGGKQKTGCAEEAAKEVEDSTAKGREAEGALDQVGEACSKSGEDKSSVDIRGIILVCKGEDRGSRGGLWKVGHPAATEGEIRTPTPTAESKPDRLHRETQAEEGTQRPPRLAVHRHRLRQPQDQRKGQSGEHRQ